MKKFIKYIPISILSLLIIMNLYLGINKAVTKDPVPRFLGIAPLFVISGSMEPAIYPGDLIIIKEQKIEKYKEQDIVTYLKQGVPFTHRIISISEEGYVLKGDNNNIPDDIVDGSKFIGKMILRIPFIGRFIMFFKTPIGLIILVSLFGAIFYLMEYLDRKKEAE